MGNGGRVRCNSFRQTNRNRLSRGASHARCMFGRKTKLSPPYVHDVAQRVYGYYLRMKAAKRKSLRKSDFVYPPGSRIGRRHGRYPIDTKKRARAALRYSARADTAGTYKTVSNKVHKRYPSLSTS
jgi:hypothetical protein